MMMMSKQTKTTPRRLRDGLLNSVPVNIALSSSSPPVSPTDSLPSPTSLTSETSLISRRPFVKPLSCVRVPSVQSILSSTSDVNYPGRIKKSPSSPAFKKSASVIYEEQIIVDGDEDDDGLEVGTGTESATYSNNDESPGGAGSPPPKYFELNLPSRSLPSPPAMSSSPPSLQQQQPSHSPLNRSPSKIYYRSYTREESICDRSERSNRSSFKRRGTMTTFCRGSDKMSDATEGLTFVLSALYAKVLVIIGLCFPMAEVISHRIPIGWYEGFYLYLYLGSVLFLIITYTLRHKSRKRSQVSKKGVLSRVIRSWFCLTDEGSPEGSSSAEVRGATFVLNSASDSTISERDDIGNQRPLHFGSFYLRLGAVAFGIGSMIYSGLEFGQFFELESKEHCYSFLYGFTPSSNMAFTFFQLYFVFMNSSILISKHHVLGISFPGIIFSSLFCVICILPEIRDLNVYKILFVLLFLSCSSFNCSSFWFDAYDCDESVCLASCPHPGN